MGKLRYDCAMAVVILMNQVNWLFGRGIKKRIAFTRIVGLLFCILQLKQLF